MLPQSYFSELFCTSCSGLEELNLHKSWGAGLPPSRPVPRTYGMNPVSRKHMHLIWTDPPTAECRTCRKTTRLSLPLPKKAELPKSTGRLVQPIVEYRRTWEDGYKRKLEPPKRVPGSGITGEVLWKPRKEELKKRPKPDLGTLDEPVIKARMAEAPKAIGIRGPNKHDVSDEEIAYWSKRATKLRNMENGKKFDKEYRLQCKAMVDLIRNKRLPVTRAAEIFQTSYVTVRGMMKRLEKKG